MTAESTSSDGMHKGWMQSSTCRAVEESVPGDIVVFDWDGGLPDHVGIVVSCDLERLRTVEGNTAVGDDSDGGEVMRRSRRLADVELFGRV